MRHAVREPKPKHGPEAATLMRAKVVDYPDQVNALTAKSPQRVEHRPDIPRNPPTAFAAPEQLLRPVNEENVDGTIDPSRISDIDDLETGCLQRLAENLEELVRSK